MLVVTGVSVPEVPVMVIVADPVAAVEAAVSVSTLEVADEVGLNAAVTPVGMPVAAKATLPVNPPWSVTVTVLDPVPPGITLMVAGEAERVKPSGPVTVSVMSVVTGVSVPEVPVMVIGYAPATAVAATAIVATVEVGEDVGLNVTVTPVGAPDAANATLPVNGLMSVTVMVSVPLAPGATDKDAAEGLSVKPPVPLTVRVMGVVTGASVPEVPVMVIG
jgi:hypothetical protein